MFYQPDLFDATQPPASPASPDALDLPDLIERIAATSRRPRYTFLVLNLIARAAGKGGRAGPCVEEQGRSVPIRDWLCDALIPIAQRDFRRRCITAEIRAALIREGGLPDDAAAAERVVDQHVRERVRHSGRCNVSRAVSDLVRAGLLQRHYQGYRVDHQNRGAQREAVYTVTPTAMPALGIIAG